MEYSVFLIFNDEGNGCCLHFLPSLFLYKGLLFLLIMLLLCYATFQFGGLIVRLGFIDLSELSQHYWVSESF